MCEINKITEMTAELHINVALEQEASEAQLMADKLQLKNATVLFLFGCLIVALCCQVSTFECIVMY